MLLKFMIIYCVPKQIELKLIYVRKVVRKKFSYWTLTTMNCAKINLCSKSYALLEDLALLNTYIN